MKGEASSVLLRFVLFVKDKVLTLSLNVKTARQLVLETMYNINKYNSSNYQDFFHAPHYYGLTLLRILNRGPLFVIRGVDCICF